MWVFRAGNKLVKDTLRENGRKIMREFKDLKIAVAGTGYVGLSIATLLAQDNVQTSYRRISAAYLSSAILLV